MKFLLSNDSLIKVLKGAALAGLGAAIAYGADYVSGGALGTMGPLVAAALSVAANYVRKLVEENSAKPE